MTAPQDIALFIDPISRRFEQDGLFDLNNARLNGDNILAPYVYLRDWFQSRGVAVHTADRLMAGECVRACNIYIAMGTLERYQALVQRPDVVLSAFFALECPIVEPTIYRAISQVQDVFRRVFSFSDTDSLKPFTNRPLKVLPFQIPQSYASVRAGIWEREQRDFLVIINANKLPRVYYQELYTERQRAVEFFSRTREVDLYGVGWDQAPNRVGKTWLPYTVRAWQRQLWGQWLRLFPDPLLVAAQRVYRGSVDAKLETLGRYTFALCFENMVLKGWITEKIFDCFFAGTIPIYWGAPDITDYIPKECFIDRRDYADYADLRRFLKALEPSDIRRYRDAARAFLTSPGFRPFTQEAFVELIAGLVMQDTGLQL
ncbi:glycosyltransferase family 10 domain-containing protein [Anthocerotibacter panamensis]|uniref:glycosyltransferase family 10 domain-containing protein n=1 Tax=Anthocerotibacter panamensis TaxID=2857077 RepID=UPI001C403733|nr:glycosyltransferase family 10 [Anthocerotibacter panamensis]